MPADVWYVLNKPSCFSMVVCAHAKFTIVRRTLNSTSCTLPTGNDGEEGTETYVDVAVLKFAWQLAGSCVSLGCISCLSPHLRKRTVGSIFDLDLR